MSPPQNIIPASSNGNSIAETATVLESKISGKEVHHLYYHRLVFLLRLSKPVQSLFQSPLHFPKYSSCIYIHSFIYRPLHLFPHIVHSIHGFNILLPVGHMLSTHDLILINTCTDIKQGKWACINKWVFMKQLMYKMKCASDGGGSNPVQVADDFTFWNFLPDQQAKRSVHSSLILL
jgi:hypothetical protein